MNKIHGAWLVALVAWVTVTACAQAADPEPVVRLEMSTRLTLEPEGTAPSVAASAVATDADTAPPSRTGWSWPWILLAALVGAGLAWKWVRRPAPLQPAGDPIARAKMDGLRAANRALQADLRAVTGKGKDAWQNTLRSARSDLDTARRSLDARIDAERALEADLDAVRLQQRQLQEERDALDATLTDVRGQLLRSDTALNEARSRAREVDENLTATRKQVAILTDSLDERSDEFVALADEHKEFKSKGALLQAAYDDADHALRLLREQVEPAREEAAQAQKALAQMLDKNLALEARIAQLSRDGGPQPDTGRQEIASLRAALEQSRNEVLEAQSQNTRLSAALGQARDELTVVREANAGAHADNANLQTMLTTAEDRVDAQSSSLHELDDEIQTLRAQIADHVAGQSDSAAQNETLRTLQEANDALREQLAGHDERAAHAQSLAASLAAVQGENQSLREQLAEHAERETQAQDLATSLADMQHENQSLREQAAERETRAQALATSLDAAQNENQSLREQLGEHAERETETHKQAASLSALQDENQTLRAQLADRADRRDQAERQATSLHELGEENEKLRSELEQRDRSLAQTVKRLNQEQHTQTSAPNVAPFDAKWTERNIEQLTRSRDAALDEMRALRARLDGDISDYRSEEQRLAHAQREIKMLKADLRVRADVIKALERDAEQLSQVQEALEDQSSQVAFLKNELALALDEVTRVKKTLRGVMARGGQEDSTTAALRAKLEELQARLATKDQIIATLEIGRQKLDTRVVDAELAQLRADQRASVSVIRFLESEVQRLGGVVESSSAG